MAHGLSSKIVIACVGIFTAWMLAPAVGADPSATWYEDARGYEEAVHQQKVRHAPMLVYFRVDWCPHCRAFDQLLEDPKVRSQLDPYIKVRINPEHGDAETKIFEEGFEARGYPALFFQGSDTASPSRISAQGPADQFVAQFAP